MDDTYKKLLNLIQEEFPLTNRPFLELGKKVGLSEEEVLAFLTKLKEEGVLRHLGASPDSHKLGHFTCLCACKVSSENLEVAEKIAELPEVTHAYLRDHELNYWFTLVLPSRENLEPYLMELERKFNVKIRAFPASKKFKVKAVFSL